MLLLVTYNIIRTFAFGIHATKSIYCLITSLMLFIGGVYVVKYMSLNIYVKAIISIILLICIYKYAPADTYKRPLINERKRKKYKVISTILGIAYVILIIIFNNYIISNYLLIGMLETVIMIHPIVYKIFNLPFLFIFLHKALPARKARGLWQKDRYFYPAAIASCRKADRGY